MLGSADSISCTNTIINTIVAQELCEFADELEKSDNFEKDLKELLVKTIKEHKAIVFNGNGYAEEWLEEAVNVRKLPNLVSTVDALPEYTRPEFVAMFEKFKVYTATEINSRTEILLENYSKVINIEALTMLDMAKKLIIPACIEYNKTVCDAAASKIAIGLDANVEKSIASKISSLNEGIYNAVKVLDEKVITAQGQEEGLKMARFYRNEVFAQMQTLRALVDEMEMCISSDIWPLPSYSKLLFSV